MMQIATYSMKNILMRLANTIVANLDNTVDDSLIDGKTGVAGFPEVFLDKMMKGLDKRFDMSGTVDYVSEKIAEKLEEYM